MTHDELIEKVAKELERSDTREYGWTPEQFDVWWHHDPLNRNHHRQKLRAKAAISTILSALLEPTEGMTGSVRHILMWLGETRPTEKSLMEMCERRGVEPPDGCGAFDHVPSKAAQAYWIWQQMLAASALGEQEE